MKAEPITQHLRTLKSGLDVLLPCLAEMQSLLSQRGNPNHQAALLAIEKVLALLRSVQTLEGTNKDDVEHLLEMAVENLKK
jgi:hypothetical protein